MIFQSTKIVTYWTWVSASFAATLPAHQGLESRSCTNGPNSRDCWTDGFSVSTDSHFSWPNTGVTVTYHLELSLMNLAPDGFSRPMMVINGQYPGPAITANWGDTVSVTVTNSLPNNGSSIHFHGIRQLNNNQMDGTPGITECPIPPGGSKTYTFQATQYGTSWYHSHWSVQYGDGIVGPIIINGPTTSDWDIDLGTLPITDWFHTPIFAVNAAESHATTLPTADNGLINGSMTSSFGGQYSQTTLTPGKRHLLRLINTGVDQYFHVGLDNHQFTVVAADFTPIQPFVTNSLVIGIGQRYDVIINADQPVDNYFFRAGTGGTGCDGPNANAANIRSIFSYSGADPGTPTSSGSLPNGCGDQPSLVPYVSTTVPSGTPKDLSVSFSPLNNGGIFIQWRINGSAIKIDWNHPTLEYVINGSSNFPTSENIYPIGPANVWSYWLVEDALAGPPLPHPIHLHGHDFFILGSGTGTFSSGSLLNYNNPTRRDTASLPAKGWLVIAFPADNPGAWLLHCHVAFHVSEGFGAQFLERSNDIIGAVGDLSGFTNGCNAWNSFQATSRIQQIDSGL